VASLFRTQTDRLLTVTMRAASLQVTPQHPFWVRGRGWINAGDLKIGDRLTIRSGAEQSLTGVTGHDTSTTVYNFEVEGLHNYYITDAQLLVHNCGDSIRDELNAMPRGRQEHVSEVKTEQEMRETFDRWVARGRGTDVTPSTYNGKIMRLEDGTLVGYRSTSRSGGATIDVKFINGETRKVHLP
jgi:hypothetical protein